MMGWNNALVMTMLPSLFHRASCLDHIEKSLIIKGDWKNMGFEGLLRECPSFKMTHQSLMGSASEATGDLTTMEMVYKGQKA